MSAFYWGQSKFLNTPQFFVIALFFFVFMASPSYAQDQHNCFKNAISDYVCPQNTNVAPVGSAANIINMSGADIFGSGSPFFSSLGGGSNNPLSSILGLFSGLYDDLPPILQNALMAQLSALLNGDDLDPSDLMSLVQLFTQVQGGFDALPTLSCGGGTLNGDYLVYAQNAYAQKLAQLDMAQLIGGNLSIGNVINTIQSDTVSSICTPQGGATNTQGATSAGGTGTPTQAPADPGDPPGTVQAPSSVTDGPGGWNLAKSQQAISISKTDNAGSGYCAKGVANIMLQMGYPVTRGNAHDWDDTLPQNGWTLLSGVTPENAPPGAILVFDSDIHAGKPVGNTGGAKYGHVEIVTTTTDGQRLYVSDKARSNWGGTVPDNFVGAYVLN